MCKVYDVSQMLRSMMEAQDQLQREYISKKEGHRALEMQNYIGLRRNTGTFDPDRSEVIVELLCCVCMFQVCVCQHVPMCHR